jgi:DNA anti-recombination protein RmuC
LTRAIAAVQHRDPMSGKDDNGDVVDLTVVILREIRDEVRGVKDEVRGVKDEVQELKGEVRETNKRLDDTNKRLDDTNRRMTAGFAQLGKQIEQLSSRIDHVLIGPLGGSVRDLTRRMEVVEQRLDDLTDPAR